MTTGSSEGSAPGQRKSMPKSSMVVSSVTSKKRGKSLRRVGAQRRKGSSSRRDLSSRDTVGMRSSSRKRSTASSPAL